MRYTRFLTVFFALLSLYSCTSHDPKELIVNKWKATGLSGEALATMADSTKKRMISSLEMEFTKDGKCTMTGLSDQPIKSNYTIGPDGKTLSITRERDKQSMPGSIDTISSNKLVLTDIKRKLQISFSAE